MKLEVKLVTVIDVVAVNAEGETKTFKKSENPALANIKVGDTLFLDGGDLKVQDNASVTKQAKAALEEHRSAPSGARGSASKRVDISTQF